MNFVESATENAETERKYIVYENVYTVVGSNKLQNCDSV